MIVTLLGALLIGVSLGLLGSGGSILTVPVLVYVVGQDEKIAIAGSLLVVGCIAAVGGLIAARRRVVDWSSVLWFGVPGMLGTWLGAMLGGWMSGTAQILLFVAVMCVAGVLMLRPSPVRAATAPRRKSLPIAIEGLSVGALTGVVGVGGGFLIVPALVLLGGLPMRRAVGTSLMIIAMKSFSGFAKYLDVLAERGLGLDWSVLGMFALIGTIGSFAGGWASQRVDQELLRKIFAVLLFVMAIAIGGANAARMMSGKTTSVPEPAAPTQYAERH